MSLAPTTVKDFRKKEEKRNQKRGDLCKTPTRFESC
jgi:hypothetical protein